MTNQDKDLMSSLIYVCLLLTLVEYYYFDMAAGNIALGSDCSYYFGGHKSANLSSPPTSLTGDQNLCKSWYLIASTLSFANPQTVLFNYGSFDLFSVVDLGLTSQKKGRSLAILRRETSI